MRCGAGQQQAATIVKHRAATRRKDQPPYQKPSAPPKVRNIAFLLFAFLGRIPLGIPSSLGGVNPSTAAFFSEGSAGDGGASPSAGSPSSSAGSPDAFYRAFVPELGSVLYPAQIELVKRCLRSERGEQDRVGEAVRGEA